MTDRPFIYDQRLLEQCAESNLAAEISKESEDPRSFQDTIPGRPFEHDESCLQLFHRYAEHYQRSYDASDYNLGRGGCNEGKESGSVNLTYRVGKKLRSFVSNAVFVHSHNKEAGLLKQHRVTLNRFSDVDLDEVLASEDIWNDYGRHLWEEQVWDEANEDDFSEAWSKESGVITRLSTEEIIYDIAADLAIGKGSMNKLNPKKHTRDEPLPDKFLRVPVDGQEDPFETPELDNPDLDGSLLSIKRNHHLPKNKASPDDDVHDDEPAVDGDFSTYLNGATADNPDGIGIVNPPFDQVSMVQVI